MTLSTTQLLLRLALALILPLWARSTNQDEIYAVCLIVIVLTISAYRTCYTVDFNLVKDVTVALCGTFIVSYVADYAVVGPWMRLGMTYLLSWDALLYLFPDDEHTIRVLAAREKSLRSSPNLISSLVFAAILTMYLVVKDYLNTHGSKFRALIISFLVLCAISGPLQHCVIYIQHMVLYRSGEPCLDEEGTINTVKPESEAKDITSVHTESKSGLPPTLENGKNRCWAEGSLVSRGYGDWELLMAQVISELPKVQVRPSARKKG